MEALGGGFVHNPARPASEAQKDCLAQLGVALGPRLSSYEADRLIREHHERWARLPATEAQRGFLRKKGRWREGMGRGEANELIGRLVGGPVGP
jgi:hypothetical protein